MEFRGENREWVEYIEEALTAAGFYTTKNISVVVGDVAPGWNEVVFPEEPLTSEALIKAAYVVGASVQDIKFHKALEVATPGGEDEDGSGDSAGFESVSEVYGTLSVNTINSDVDSDSDSESPVE